MESNGMEENGLRERWRSLEEQLDSADGDEERLLAAKASWFSDAFEFLVKLPEEAEGGRGSHIWCDHPHLMGPLLETFHAFPLPFAFAYAEEGEREEGLPLLWRRLSHELSRCTQCICQHHQALRSYAADFQTDSVRPLLRTVAALDEQRVSHQLRQLNARLRAKQYEPARDTALVVALLFEVLMFPLLLDDGSLATEFQIFLEAMDDAYQLTLSADQHYPGVFALLFFPSSKTRAIGLRLARSMPKLRLPTDLEPLHPLLHKWIRFLETDLLPTTNDNLRPRLQLSRPHVWLGIKSLLGFLDGPAFEDGILDRYPVFLNIILNHVSDDTSDFSYAVTCLKASFEMLGCKLWLRASLSPSVMRNTLLGHCFHTREEKSHKDIFDLFIPFLQSLESLQDGEHEKQRRNILYFLLHQVTRSSNFSAFTRQNACKIAILIVYRGYTMEPPSPPFECAHMWGPSLVSSLKDTGLHNSLRQPAFDLINSIIISDACALVSQYLSLSKGDSGRLYDEEEDTLFLKDTEKDKSCWTEFCLQWNLTSSECYHWRCIPLLWYISMCQVDPVNLPVSFSMAIFWVLSRSSMADLSSGNEQMSQSVDEWLVSNAGEISWCFKWEIPSGSNDGGDGKESRNSVKVAAATCTVLLRSLKRFCVQFMRQIQKQELQRQWTWAPAMAESLVLLLVDPNDSIRQTGRAILEHVSHARMLTVGLQFLCSTDSCLSAMYIGLKYALRLVQVDSISQKFPILHHMFFVARKLLKEVIEPDKSPSVLHKGAPGTLRRQTEGGFIRQPGFSYPSNQLPRRTACLINMLSLEEFCYFLSTILWPFIVKCLEKGDVIYNEKNCEMASVRLLEMLPSVVERLCLGASTQEDCLPAKFPFQDLAWLMYLANWGKSSLVILTRHWKQCILSVLQILRASVSFGSTQQLLALEAIVFKDKIDMEIFLEKVSACVAGALFKEAVATTRVEHPLSDAIATERVPPFMDNTNIVMQEARQPSTKFETEKVTSANRNATHRPEETIDGSVDVVTKINCFEKRDFSKDKRLNKPSESAATTSNKPLKPAKPALPSEKKQLKPPSKAESLLMQLVQDNQPDPLDVALHQACRAPIPLPLTKTLPLPPKRQVVELSVPNGSRNSFLGNRNTTVVSRFKRANIDKWYKEILQMDYFSAVSISKNDKKEKELNMTLKKIPLSFVSESQYLEIFRPLVLEEFKAQLRAVYVENSVEDIVCGSFCVLSVERVDEFLVVRGRADEKEFLRNQGGCFENDLILLTKEPFKKNEQPVHVLGKVDRREKGDKKQAIILVIRFLISNELARFSRVRKYLTERSKWYLNRVFNLTPQMREFQALSSLCDIPILAAILNPLNVPANSGRFHNLPLDGLSEPIRRFLTTSYNESQLQAIDAAIRIPHAGKDFELSLIQGPPGTGKTRTIVAIVSALLASPLVQRKSSFSSCASLHPHTGSNQTRNPTRRSQSSSVARAWQDLALARQLMEPSLQHKASSSEGVEKALRGRVLICAQSNAAVDELLSRLSDGLIGSDGQKYKPYLVRVGNQKTIHPSSLPFFIDTLVEQKVSDDMKSKANVRSNVEFESTISLRAKMEKVVDDIRKYEARRAKLDSNDAEDESSTKVSVSRSESRDIPDDQIDAKLNHLYRQKREINSDLNIAYANERRLADENRALKQRVRKQILMDAEIVLTTLSGAGGDLYSVCSEAASAGKFGNVSENTLFDVVVIDEAAQALEPATLIPLQLLKSRGTKCVMVGDPKQLPATVISDIASKFSYECSMFERLQRAGHPVIMLTEQYRMHPEICRFPSTHFYDSKLLNGAQMEDRFAPFHEIKCLGPYIFFDVNDGQECLGRSAVSQSLLNKSEAEAATEILRFLCKRYPSEIACKKIGIITPYRSQLYLLRSKFSSTFGPEAVSDMELNTVDGFQGREVDILLLSTVRASSSDESGSRGVGGIGFVADVRRMNVALTRAKFSLWIFGNARTLQVNPHWTALIQDARERNLFASISQPYSSAFTKELPGLLPDSVCKGTRVSSRDKPPPEKSMWMRMPGKERELESVTGELTKRINVNDVAIRGPGGTRKGSRRSCEDQEMTSGSKGNRENFGASLLMTRELEAGKRRSMELVKGVKEAAKTKLSSENHENSHLGQGSGTGICRSELVKGVVKEAAKTQLSSENHENSHLGQGSGTGICRSQQFHQTDAVSLRGKDSHIVTREKRRVMPMPMSATVLQGSRGHRPSISDKNRTSGGAEVVERTKGKAEVRGAESVLNSARKRRRQDVDSLLSSALISSKKKP